MERQKLTVPVVDGRAKLLYQAGRRLNETET
jgi:hypothetical protein